MDGERAICREKAYSSKLHLCRKTMSMDFVILHLRTRKMIHFQYFSCARLSETKVSKEKGGVFFNHNLCNTRMNSSPIETVFSHSTHAYSAVFRS